MRHLTIQWLFILCLAVIAVSQEPEPENMYTTEGPEPAPEVVPVSTTTTVTEHRIHMSMTVNISQILNEDAFRAFLMNGIKSAPGHANATVRITIHFMRIETTYAGFAEVVINEIIQAYSAMTDINETDVTVNGTSYSGRRLSSNVETHAIVNDTGSVDVISAGKDIINKNSPADLVNELKMVNPSRYDNLSLTMPNPPSARVEATTHISGTDNAPSSDDVIKHVEQNVPGASVTVISNPTGAPPPPAPGPAPPPPPSPGPIQDEDHATMASCIMPIWLAVYSFAMS